MLIEQPKNVAMPLTTVRLNPLVHDRVPPSRIRRDGQGHDRRVVGRDDRVRRVLHGDDGLLGHSAPTAPPPGWVVEARCWVDPTRKPLLVAGVHIGLLVAISA